jgi:hypothetical protein
MIKRGSFARTTLVAWLAGLVPDAVRSRKIRSCAVCSALAGALVVPVNAAAVVPVDGTWNSVAAGRSKPDVTMHVHQGRIVERIGNAPLSATRFRCRRGRSAFLRTVTMRRGGRFRGRRANGAFDGRTGRFLYGDRFEVRGRFISPRLAVGRMRFTNTIGKPCRSGWVKWRAAPTLPVKLRLTGPGSMVIPGNAVTTATVENTGVVTSPRTDVRLWLSGFAAYNQASSWPTLASVTAGQGTCGSLVRDVSGDAYVECALGPLGGGRSATVVVTERWTTASCEGRSDYSAGSATAHYAAKVRTPLNDAREWMGPGVLSDDSEGDDTYMHGQCPEPAG